MEEDAKTWALPHLESLQKGTAPFSGQWSVFEKEFTARFMPHDVAEAAKEAIKKIKQGKNSVAKYEAEFSQYSPQTGWSQPDLRDRMYDGLSDRVKDALALSDRPIKTYSELSASARIVDERIRQRDSEKKGHPANTSSNSQARHPDAMDIDASRQQPAGGNNNKSTKTRADYQTFMKGKCYGCGKTDHAKKDGNHERDICHHCQKTGHRSNVCMTKFMGKPGKAKAAATDTPSSDSTPSPSSTATAAATPAPAKGKSQADLMAQLMEQVKKQQEQIEALKSTF
jgi:Retrotransposon gag protein